MSENTKVVEKNYLSDEMYDLLKWIVQIWLPAVASLYFGLAQIWGLPAAEQVVGTMALVSTFAGVSLRISANRYLDSDAAYNGEMIVTQDEGGIKTFSLELSAPPEELQYQDVISFRVKKVNV